MKKGVELFQSFLKKKKKKTQEKLHKKKVWFLRLKTFIIYQDWRELLSLAVIFQLWACCFPSCSWFSLLLSRFEQRSLVFLHLLTCRSLLFFSTFLLCPSFFFLRSRGRIEAYLLVYLHRCSILFLTLPVYHKDKISCWCVPCLKNNPRPVNYQFQQNLDYYKTRGADLMNKTR